MRPTIECGICTFKWTYERALLEGIKETSSMLSLLKLIEESLQENTNLGILNSEAVFKIYEQNSFSSPYFSGFKRACNENAEKILPQAKNFLKETKDQRSLLERAVMLACASNVSPVEGPKSPYRFDETLNNARERKIKIDPAVLDKLFRVERILYIPDNAGEIGFDGLLIEILKDMGKRVSLFVKKAPFFDDATEEDALYFGLDRIVDGLFVNEGFFVPSRLEGEKKEVFEKADLIISKGIGNYDGIGGERIGIPILFMFKIKCKPIARLVKGEIGELRVFMEV